MQVLVSGQYGLLWVLFLIQPFYHFRIPQKLIPSDFLFILIAIKYFFSKKILQ